MGAPTSFELAGGLPKHRLIFAIEKSAARCGGANLKYRMPPLGLRYFSFTFLLITALNRQLQGPFKKSNSKASYFPSQNRLYIKVKQGCMMIFEGVDYQGGEIVGDKSKGKKEKKKPKKAKK